MPARVALTLRTLCGLTPAEIGRAFLVTEPTMEKRLVRARAKIKNAGIPYRVPPPELWAERVEGVLSVLYLMFNEGYAASSGDSLLRVDVSAEAIRLTRSLPTCSRVSRESEVRGLLALMLLTDARRPARVRDGHVVPLGEQDRSLWDLDLVAEGSRLLDAEPPWGPYAVQARIALCHDVAARPADTDWAAIAELYTLLPATPVVELNRAVAVSMADGPAAALPMVEALGDDLGDYYLYAATVADLHARMGRRTEAAAALATAIEQAPDGRRAATAAGASRRAARRQRLVTRAGPVRNSGRSEKPPRTSPAASATRPTTGWNSSRNRPSSTYAAAYTTCRHWTFSSSGSTSTPFTCGAPDSWPIVVGSGAGGTSVTGLSMGASVAASPYSSNGTCVATAGSTWPALSTAPGTSWETTPTACSPFGVSEYAGALARSIRVTVSSAMACSRIGPTTDSGCPVRIATSATVAVPDVSVARTRISSGSDWSTYVMRSIVGGTDR